MPITIISLLEETVGPNAVEEWPYGGLELSFFAEYFQNRDLYNLPAEVRLRAALISQFFASDPYKKLKSDYDLNWDVKTKALLYPKIKPILLAKHYNNARLFQTIANKIAAEIEKYFIKQSSLNPISQKYLDRMRSGELTPIQLAEKLAEQANTLIFYLLHQEKSHFQWPDDTSQITNNALCQLFINQKITLGELASLTEEQIARFQHKLVSAYLIRMIALNDNMPELKLLYDIPEAMLALYPVIASGNVNLPSANLFDDGRIAKFSHKVVAEYHLSLLALGRRVLNLEMLYALNENALLLYPLVANHKLSVAEANSFSFDSLEGKILLHFINTANFEKDFDLKRLFFILEFIKTPLFANMKKSLVAIDQEINHLNNEKSGIFTVSGLKKVEQLTLFKTELIETMIASLDKLYSSEKPAKKKGHAKPIEIRSIDADVAKFTLSLQQNLHGKTELFLKQSTISTHRNHLSSVWKNILDSLIWLIKPVYEFDQRNRLFSPRSASVLYHLEEELQTTPRCGTAA